MKDNLFPGLPIDLTSLSVDELQEKLEQYQEIAKKIGERDPEILADRTMAEVLEQFQAGVEDIEKIREEIEAKGAVDEEFAAQLAELQNKAGLEVVAEGDDGGEDGDGDGDGDGEPEPVVEVAGEAEPVAELEPVAASAKFTGRPASRPLPKTPVEHQPVETADTTPGFTASAGVPGVDAGESLDRHSLAMSILRKREQSVSTPEGAQEKVIVASARYAEQWPDERKLTGDLATDQQKIDAVINPEALTASGGLCAPVSNYYEIRNWSSSTRPVRDGAMAGFNAVRGGLKFTQGITLAEIDEGVGIKTAAQDAAGGTTAAKTCQIIECPDFDEVQLDMIYKCLQFGNLNSRAWPEMVAAFVDAASAAHAALAETSILDQMAAFSTPVGTVAASYGAFSTILYTLLRAGAGMRSRHRLPDGVVLRAVLPAWGVDLLMADLINSQFYRFERTRDGVAAAIREMANIQITWTQDGTTTGGQVFGAQGSGALVGFPTTIQMFLYPEGSFLFLDGGTLDLGIVRDSILNNTNDYQMFAETFEIVAFIGIESLLITQTVCPTGTTGPTATAITC